MDKKHFMDNGYQKILHDLKQKIKQARQQAALTVNTQLLTIYWEIGRTILVQQKKDGWGAKIVDQLANDLRIEFPDMQGFSIRNIKYMRAFAEAYPNFSIVQPVVAQMQNTENEQDTFVQPLVAQIPWAHHLVILTKVKPSQERLFYLSKTAENGWSKNILVHQIDGGLYKRQGAALTNFELTLPKPASDLARETLKNPYLFDFLSIGEEMQEREMEKALTTNLKKFMLELGKGFAYVGNQYNLVVADDDFFLDLLFYNYQLHCFVIFELKVGDFKPEFAGKLNFYINTVNEKMKGAEDRPTIGVLLCKTPNETVVEYSLQGIQTPMGVAEYEFTKALPKELQSGLPTIKALEDELDKEIVLAKSPLQEKADRLKDLIAKSNREEMQKEKNRDDIKYLFNEVLPQLQKEIENNLAFLRSEFSKMKISRKINETASPYLMEIDLEGHFIGGDITLLGIVLNMEGFKKGGTHAFSINKELLIVLHRFKYGVGKDIGRPNIEKLYHQKWSKKEIDELAEEWCTEVIDDVTEWMGRIN